MISKYLKNTDLVSAFLILSFISSVLLISFFYTKKENSMQKVLGIDNCSENQCGFCRNCGGIERQNCGYAARCVKTENFICKFDPTCLN